MELFSVHSIIPFLTLCALELILGIDNIIFISIASDKLPKHQQQKVRTVGLSLALITRLALLLSLFWIIGLKTPLFAIFGHEISGSALLLLFGGLFLMAKSTYEIHQKMSGNGTSKVAKKYATFTGILVQILILDLVFSLDSILTAVGMVNAVSVMASAIIVSTCIMLVASRWIADFINRYPTIRMLALSFLLVVGVSLFAEGLGQHFPKGYLYFAMGYSVLVEIMNIYMRKKKLKTNEKSHY